MSDFTHGLIAYKLEDNELKIYHFVGYWSEPTQIDIDHIEEELRTDEEFGLTEMMDELSIGPATSEVVKHFNGVYKELKANEKEQED